MNLLVVSATDFEIKHFIEVNKASDVLITGIGIPATVFHLTKQLAQKKYDLVIQAGIAGSYTAILETGKVCLVKTDTFGDIGIDEKKNFKTLFETGLVNKDDLPFSNGWLVNDHEYLKSSVIPLVRGITINTITDNEMQIKQVKEKFSADIESMEGAAFHYVCLQQKVKFLQLRSISNVVGERDKTKWKMKEAIINLDTELKKLIKSFS